MDETTPAYVQLRLELQRQRARGRPWETAWPAALTLVLGGMKQGGWNSWGSRFWKPVFTVEQVEAWRSAYLREGSPLALTMLVEKISDVPDDDTDIGRQDGRSGRVTVIA